jgi:protein SCO1/2
VTRRAALVAALLATPLLFAACGGGAAGSKAVTAAPKPSPYRGFLLKRPTRAPSFRLRDQDGRRLGPQDLRGHWLVISFLYTHCPDVCPLIANNVGSVLRQRPELRAIAISVDPKRDTPAAVRSFLRAHRLPPTFRYLTGTRAQLQPVWRDFHVAATAGPDATVSHSAFELLVDPTGRERLLYDSKLTAPELAHDLRLIM